MNSKLAVRRAAVLTVILLGLPGCGGPSDQPELGQVHGAITLDGKPLSGVAVVFQPDSGRPARGRTDAEGKYELTYIRDIRGTKVGRNRVEVAPSEEGEEEEDNSADADAEADSQQAQRRALSGRPKIPARYNTKSELEVDVKPGDNTFDFQLESKTSNSRRGT